MTLDGLASKYILKAERALNDVMISERSKLVDAESVKEVVDEAKRYLEDAKFYLNRKRFETSLASVTYCEGLLDALRLLGLVDFSWQEARDMSGKRKVVLATGTFDLLHYGHVYYLTEAKKAGGEDAKLVVVVARDSTVEKLKGSRPIIPEDQRKAVIKALKVVDEAMLGHEEMDMSGIIEEVKPDMIAVGHDQRNIERLLHKAVTEKGLKVQIVRIGRFGEEELNSSSKIKRKIVEKYRR